MSSMNAKQVVHAEAQTLVVWRHGDCENGRRAKHCVYELIVATIDAIRVDSPIEAAGEQKTALR